MRRRQRPIVIGLLGLPPARRPSGVPAPRRLFRALREPRSDHDASPTTLSRRASPRSPRRRGHARRPCYQTNPSGRDRPAAPAHGRHAARGPRRWQATAALSGRRGRPPARPRRAGPRAGRARSSSCTAIRSSTTICPSMDDDDLRRGRPTVHKAFDEATAILAGDALQTLAFEVLADPATDPDGPCGPISCSGSPAPPASAAWSGGQMLDLAAEGRYGGAAPGDRARRIARLQAMKTGAILAFSVEAGAILGRADADRRRTSPRSGGRSAPPSRSPTTSWTGRRPRTLGKRTGKDRESGKATLVDLLGIEGARRECAASSKRPSRALDRFGASRSPARRRPGSPSSARPDRRSLRPATEGGHPLHHGDRARPGLRSSRGTLGRGLAPAGDRRARHRYLIGEREGVPFGFAILAPRRRLRQCLPQAHRRPGAGQASGALLQAFVAPSICRSPSHLADGRPHNERARPSTEGSASSRRREPGAHVDPAGQGSRRSSVDPAARVANGLPA